MDIIEIAKKELESEVVAYTEFVLDFNKEINNVYCFYEGKEDRSYYSFRIKSHNLNNNLHHYNCNGKGNVIKVHKLVNNHEAYSKSKILYFVDKDFEENNLHHTIYVTPYYSVENFYTIDEAFENILINEFNIPKSCITYKESLDIYIKCKKLFHENIIILNSWLSCQNDYRTEHVTSTRLNIDDTLKKFFGYDIFEKIVNVDLVNITFPEELKNRETIEEIFSDSPKIIADKFERKVTSFKSSNKSEVFRGKFEMKFLVSFLRRFQDEIGKRKDSAFSRHCPAKCVS